MAVRPPPSVVFTASVVCPGQTFPTFIQTVTVPCVDCAPAAAAAAAEEDFLPEPLDVTEETPPGSESPPSEVSLPPEAPTPTDQPPTPPADAPPPENTLAISDENTGTEH